jgi:lipoate-protein ligase A
MLNFLKIRPNFLKLKFNNFARFNNNADNNKISDVEIVPQEKIKTKKIKSKPQTINVEEQFKIQPYFSQAVSSKEKSFTSISVSGLIEDPKGGKSAEKKEQLKKQKQSQKKQVAIENIKRQLPNEL